MQEIKIIPKSNYPFDREVCIVEAKNVEKLFNLHHNRCDSKEAAEYLAETFGRLSTKFKQKTLVLSEKV